VKTTTFSSSSNYWLRSASSDASAYVEFVYNNGRLLLWNVNVYRDIAPCITLAYNPLTTGGYWSGYVNGTTRNITNCVYSGNQQWTITLSGAFPNGSIYFKDGIWTVAIDNLISD